MAGSLDLNQFLYQLRDLARFNLAIDSKRRAFDLVKPSTNDVVNGATVIYRGPTVQPKTGWPGRFEITEKTRAALQQWISAVNLRGDMWLFASCVKHDAPLNTRQYARIVNSWAEMIGLHLSVYGTHSIRRAKASLIYKRTKNLRALRARESEARARSPR